MGEKEREKVEKKKALGAIEKKKKRHFLSSKAPVGHARHIAEASAGGRSPCCRASAEGEALAWSKRRSVRGIAKAEFDFDFRSRKK